jgi:serine phosphatase RsbU (regulator of sigma subunit)/anti-sigma regulatory factor (Ser/Thr protein kinase)
MTSITAFWKKIVGAKETDQRDPAASAPRPVTEVQAVDLDIAPNDPLLTYLQNMSGPIELEGLSLESAAVTALTEAGVALVIPLVSQGELVGLISLGPRMSEQAYSSDDRKLLSDLATQAAPAVRVAQLVRQQQAEARERQRIEQEMQVASLIQQTLLPRDVPTPAGWNLDAYYQPARAVGGDFYDFYDLPDGKLGIVVGDVTDKGVPAALVMATTRSILKAAAERLPSPGQVLERVNDVLHPDIPPKMFVTCLYAVLDPSTGHLQYANAGHDVPYQRHGGDVVELRATGMPLGLMPGMLYEEKEAWLKQGDAVLLYSDGLVEAHNPQREMFGFPRLKEEMASHDDMDTLNQYLLERLETFTGPRWEQEDDVMLLTIRRHQLPDTESEEGWQALTEFTLPSEPGNERQAMERVASAAAGIALGDGRREKLRTAVAEATMNAMEHGNGYDRTKDVQVEVAVSKSSLRVRITDQGKHDASSTTEAPDLAAKLAGDQSPRGWGLFLIQNMVDEMCTFGDESYHTIELIMQFGAS